MGRKRMQRTLLMHEAGDNFPTVLHGAYDGSKLVMAYTKDGAFILSTDDESRNYSEWDMGSMAEPTSDVYKHSVGEVY